PSSYNASVPTPMLVCWHRYSQSCASVSLQSLLDEECETRGWIYLAITGATTDNFGFPGAQINCTQAISYMMDPVNGLGLNVDRERIYMAGCSMGGGAAISYVGRHLSRLAGHRIAGLILVAPPVDWIHAATVGGDTGTLNSLTTYLGGDPTQCPFAWKQICGLVMDGGTANLEESMGQNLRHQCPIYVVYAGNDPLFYLPDQMLALTFMLSNIGANYMMRFELYAPIPHNWDLLNIQQSFNFISGYTLADQETESLDVLMDREEKFYWVDMIQQTTADAFSRFTGSADPAQNTLEVTDTVNMDTLRVDCDWAGLDDSKNLMLDYATSQPQEQEIQLEPLATEPTYMVDAGGVLHPEYSYESGNERSLITRAAGQTLDLKLSFEPYNLTLTADPTVPINGYLSVNLSGGEPFDTAVFFLAFSQMEFAIAYQHILVPPIPPSIFFIFPMDAAGSLALGGTIPNDPGIIGVIFYLQYLTYDKILYEVKEISNLTLTEII
ncbi:MAG: alpha/beta hydrolase, partial [Planctomycetes bacterium]|nr:alpha/beta hydrolase [Planctomycetota bacterium]